MLEQLFQRYYFVERKKNINEFHEALVTVTVVSTI